MVCPTSGRSARAAKESVAALREESEVMMPGQRLLDLAYGKAAADPLRAAIPDYAITDLGLVGCVKLEVIEPVLGAQRAPFRDLHADGRHTSVSSGGRSGNTAEQRN